MTAVKTAPKRKSAKPRAAKVTLDAGTAAGLMTANPVSIRKSATTSEAARLFTERRISAAPVIDEAGRPVGVVSSSDLVRFEGEKAQFGLSVCDPAGGNGKAGGEELPITAVMTPKVYAVRRGATAAEVVRAMLECRVHRLFVVDSGGVLVGVISALDVIRHLTGKGRVRTS
jgi:CBS domain-containing protein